MKRVGLIVGVFVAMGLVIVGLNMMTNKKTPSTKDNNNTSQSGSSDASSSSSSDTTNTPAPKDDSNFIDITSTGFAPQALTVKVGDTVYWNNRDSAKHTVTGTSTSGPGSPVISANTSYSYTFKAAGTFSYSSVLDNSFTGTITVTK
jgi:plastocyanin